MIVGYEADSLAYTVNNIYVNNCKFDGVYGKPVYQVGKAQDVHFDNLFINGLLILSDMPYKQGKEQVAFSFHTKYAHRLWYLFRNK